MTAGQTPHPDPVVVELNTRVRIVYKMQHDDNCPAEYSDGGPCLQTSFCRWYGTVEVRDGCDALGTARWRWSDKKSDHSVLREAIGDKCRPPFPSTLTPDEAAALCAEYEERSRATFAEGLS